MAILSLLLVSSLLFQVPFMTCQALPNHNVSATPPKEQTGYLTVPAASIYYETYGSGPLLLFISGANGDADIWRPLARTLSSTTNHTIVIYDRRGFSRSYLSSTLPQNYTNRLAVDVNDTRLLIQHLSPAQPVTVLGTSSGAIVALQLLLTFPDTLKTLIAHEPPALTLLPDNATLIAAQKAVYATYRITGIPLAMVQFALLQDMSFTASPTGNPGFTLDGRTSPHVTGNLAYWFEREFLQYPLHEFTAEMFKDVKGKLVLANGKATNPAGSQYRANAVLAKELGLDVDMVAGDHVGYAGSAVGDFARDLLGVLERRE
ncbi:Alpha/Beta hydrolase protein [Paraphoma chrysanthemicola]|nr:Alpha/Beta hydrolase protein [Paraphoma chrysanthemicola]